MRITYSSGTLRDIGGRVGARPRIADSLFKTLQTFGISSIRPRGCRGGRTIKGSTFQDSNSSLFTNKNICSTLNECFNIPVIDSLNRTNDNQRTSDSDKHDKSNLIEVPLEPSKKASKDHLLNIFVVNARSVCNKADVLSEYIVDNDIDILLITETWLSSSSDRNRVVLGDLVPAGYKIHHVPRKRIRGGGVGIVFKENLDLQPQASDQYSSFEHIELLMKTGNDCVRLVAMYRPPPTGKSGKPTCEFLTEFSEYVDRHTTTSGKLLICGDLNFHYDDRSNEDANKFKDTIFSLNLDQHVGVATHTHGHVLDLVLTRSTDSLDMVHDLDVHAAVFSDHSPISFNMPFRKPAPMQKEVTIRNLKDIDVEKFQNDILLSTLITSPPDDVTELIDQYNTTLSTLLESHAPARTKKITIKPRSPWYTEDIREAKKQRRKAERKWRATKLAVHLEIYRTECARVTEMCRTAKRDYFCLMIEECDHDQKKVFNIANQLMNNRKDSTLPTYVSPQELSENFADFFQTKYRRSRIPLVMSLFQMMSLITMSLHLFSVF